MSKIARVSIMVLIGVMFSGCSMLNLGKNQSKCEESGCDFSDAGVCMEPYYILEHKYKVKRYAYQGIGCKDMKVSGGY